MKCPMCKGKLEQETYYDTVNEDTTYYNYCPNCEWNDYEQMEITRGQAQEFYRDLCGTVYGNANKTQQGIMPICLIADHMRIEMEKAQEYCDAMVRYGVTERTNGMIIV